MPPDEPMVNECEMVPQRRTASTPLTVPCRIVLRLSSVIAWIQGLREVPAVVALGEELSGIAFGLYVGGSERHRRRGDDDDHPEPSPSSSAGVGP
jgi:hypothetical protein